MWVLILAFICKREIYETVCHCVNRKLIVPQKEPSPLLDRKIEELEAKFADMTDEELEDLGDDDGELGDQSLPLMQSSMSGDMDNLPYTPPQVGVECQ